MNETLAAAAASLPHLAIATAFSSAPALKLVQMLVNVAHRSESRRRQTNAARRFALPIQFQTTCHCCYSEEHFDQKANGKKKQFACIVYKIPMSSQFCSTMKKCRMNIAILIELHQAFTVFQKLYSSAQHKLIKQEPLASATFIHHGWMMSSTRASRMAVTVNLEHCGQNFSST